MTSWIPRNAIQSEDRGRSIFVQAIDRIVDLNLSLYIGTYQQNPGIGDDAAYQLQDAERLDRAMK